MGFAKMRNLNTKLRSLDPLRSASFRRGPQDCGSGVRAHGFNLIEVVLGLGLIAIGLLSAVGAFPMCLNATRDSIAESYASESADQLLHVLAAVLKTPDEDGHYENWDDYGRQLPYDKPSSTEPYSWTTLSWLSGDTVTFRCGGTDNQFYFVEQKPAGAKSCDFTGVYRVWKTAVKYSVYQDGVGWTEATADDGIAIGLNMEISWPANVPYERRAKALYHLEVYKPQS
ncbi:MAG: hypothetical protein A3K19_24205 [Lentisphaerae bacterium RIFOXYB12_FULL_65_16]|nr:MAG: hypothetical protein A3K18_32510 [Lentisphaerae bacterium RIFOXYA12_64_32]OGV87601.1 MAG: hypothetical protein A3K19_24205 [Lentisphaerae bacterium RIFOXYB12_FULL_65_16]